VGLPKLEQRVKILQHYIKKHDDELSSDQQFRGVEAALLLNKPSEGSGSVGAVDWVAQQTEGFSGSDLAELASQAAQQCLADFWQQHWWVALGVVWCAALRWACCMRWACCGVERA
jgi:SpoVK/Ycf46/Vps4 family AAA+-type ATPase